MLGHSGYLETARRAFVYAAGKFGLEASLDETEMAMDGFRHLRPYADVTPALARLHGHYTLVVLTNGERDHVEHLLRTQIDFEFDGYISVDEVGVFKPHPAVYRRAALDLGLELGQCMMVS
jgi:2-haloacid dehalogenase